MVLTRRKAFCQGYEVQLRCEHPDPDCFLYMSETMCAYVQGQAHGETQVISCLVSNYQSIVADCQREVSRAVRMALWEYRPQLALTSKPAGCHDAVLTFL